MIDYSNDKKKIVLIGAGLVGMSFAYALLGSHICEELGIIDIDKKRAEGEAMDLSHGLAFSGGNMKIYAAEYSDCFDADLAVICAGVPQKPGETRIDLLHNNAKVFEEIVSKVLASGFNGIFLVATNPVDVMTSLTRELSGFPANRVIGTGTTLDTARLRFLLGQYFAVDPRNVHAYVMGEHGDSEFVPWSQAYVSTKNVLAICAQEHGRFSKEELDDISYQVKTAAYKIIEAKRATYYGIGMALLRIARAILRNEGSVLTVSAYLQGEYGQADVNVGVPCVIGREGVRRVIELDLTKDEQEQFAKSCQFLRDVRKEI
ncbi:MAG: L-lactate dehydrogenase [Clostridia bacterium]|nr:L-lactate dehydrogenase [Clostridia bacterium]